MGTEANTGAENHQPVCSAPLNATASQKSAAKCDRNEGASTPRFTCSGMLSYFRETLLHERFIILIFLPPRDSPGVYGMDSYSSRFH